MRSIHKRIKIKQKYIVLFALMSVCFATALYARFVHPLFSHASTEPQYMSAVITADNGEVEFSPGVQDAVADFSYSKTANHVVASKIYDVKIILDDLPVDIEQKKLSVTLPVGMLWVDDASGDLNLLAQLDPTKGTNGIETVALNQQAVLGYDFSNSGTRVYNIVDGSVALTVNLKVRADSKVNLGYIQDAIVARVEVGGSSEEAHLSVNVPGGASIGGMFASSSPTIYASAGSTYTLNKDYLRSARSCYVNTTSTAYQVSRLITQIKFSMHVEGKAVMQLNSTDAQFTFDDSDSSNGNYVFTYTPTAATDGYVSIPYALVLSDELVEGETVVVTGMGETSYWQPDGSTLTLAFRNSQTATFVILPTDSDVDGVTVGWSTLNPSNEGLAHDINVSSPVRESERMTGMLGYGYVNNRGATDSAVKKVKITFDTDVLGVMLVKLPCSPNGTIESVHIKTASGIEKDVTVNLACNGYGISSNVSYAGLGIERDDYLAEIEYVLGVIPAATQLRAAANTDGSRALVFMGKRLDETQPGVATIEVFDADDPEKTTGVAKITSTVTTDSGGLLVSKAATQVKNAGETLQFSITASAYGGTGVGYIYGTKNPIIYLRSEAKDASGNYLPISNIRVVNESGRGSEDITSKFGQIIMRETEQGKVYVLDGRNVTDGSASLVANQVSDNGALSYGQLVVTFSIETDFSTPSQSHNIANMFFVQDPDDSSVSTTTGITGDPFGISEAGNGGMVRAASTNYYQIRGTASVGTENSGKHITSDTWLTWSEGSNPITIGSVSGSAADMRISLLNNSGVDITSQVVVYSPIPKKDEDWGNLSYDGQPFEFSTKLTGAISNPNSEYFTIAYGRNVTPSDNGNDLNDEGDKFAVDTTGWTASDWEEVNCIRITTDFIPANQPDVVDRYDFLYHLEVVGLDGSSDGSVDTWRPLFFQQLTNSIGDLFAGWYKGSYVSIKLANGTAYGEIFVDANENGKKDSNEQTLREAGWKIDLYDKLSNRLVQSTETNANGQYGFIELAADVDGYYMIVTNKHPIGEDGVTYLFTQKGDVSNTGSYNTDNQAEGDKTSSPAHTTAYVGPVTPSQTVGEATYNIGVVEYVESLSFSGSVSFDDQNNRFGTRPVYVTITAIASDGSRRLFNVNVSVNNNASFIDDLSKYSATGERLSYVFSSSDLTNYNKAEQATANTYNVTFTQKTATLRVHHYKKGTADSLIPDDVSTVYWGQSYETAQGQVDSDYEFDSVVGETSGTVAGDIVVTYYYKKKKGTVTTHYYIKDSTTPISEDNVREYEYGETYTTNALEEIPAAFANYELVSERPSGYTGIVRSANIEVIYYYQEKDPQISSSISITGPETIDDKHAIVPYSVEYSAHVVDYIGETGITIVLQLPYAISEDDSDLDGGVYDADSETITWTNELIYNTYTDGEDISFDYEIELAFDGASADDILVVTAEASIELSSKSNDAADSIRTLVRTPARIVFKYVDEEENEIMDSDIEEGFVGDECEHDAPDIPGYSYVEDDEINLVFGEEERTIYYRYEKVIAPAVPDTSNPHKMSPFLTESGAFDPTIFVYMFVSSSIAMVSLGIVRMNRRKGNNR